MSSKASTSSGDSPVINHDINVPATNVTLSQVSDIEFNGNILNESITLIPSECESNYSTHTAVISSSSPSFSKCTTRGSHSTLTVSECGSNCSTRTAVLSSSSPSFSECTIYGSRSTLTASECGSNCSTLTAVPLSDSPPLSEIDFHVSHTELNSYQKGSHRFTSDLDSLQQVDIVKISSDEYNTEIERNIPINTVLNDPIDIVTIPTALHADCKIVLGGKSFTSGLVGHNMNAAIVALVFSTASPISNWTSPDIDFVVSVGDHLSRQDYYKSMDTAESSVLKSPHCNATIAITDSCMCSYKVTNILYSSMPKVVTLRNKRLVSNFLTELRHFLRNNNLVLLNICNCTVAIISDDSNYYLFSPNNINSVGNITDSGFAGCIRFPTVGEVYKWILYEICLRRSGDSYSFTGISVTDWILNGREFDGEGISNHLASLKGKYRQQVNQVINRMDDTCQSDCDTAPLQPAVVSSTSSHEGLPPSVIPGSLHQGDRQFSDLSRGNQCTAIAAMSACCAQIIPLHLWTPSSIDQIVRLGDEYYTSIRTENPAAPVHLSADDLVQEITIGNYDCSFRTALELFGLVEDNVDDEISYEIQSLMVNMQRHLQNGVCGVLTVNDLSIAVMMQNNIYYVLDSHSRNINGDIDPEGTAILCSFSRLQCIHDYVIRTMNSPSIKRNQYHLSILTVINIRSGTQLYALDDIPTAVKTSVALILSINCNQDSLQEDDATEIRDFWDTPVTGVDTTCDSNVAVDVSADDNSDGDRIAHSIDNVIRPYVKPTKNSSRRPVDRTTKIIIEPEYFFGVMFDSICEHSVASYNADCKNQPRWKYCGSQLYDIQSTVHIECQNCGFRISLDSESTSPSVLSTNDAAVLGALSNGFGHYQLQHHLATMNLPTISFDTYHRSEMYLSLHIAKAASKCMKDAAAESVERAVQEGRVIEANGKTIATTVVVGDGEWGGRSYGRKFSSSTGSATVVDFYTKKILDFGYANKYCVLCRRNTREWHICYRNYAAAAPSTSMESAIILTLFQRSVSQNGLIYTHYISDGDSSSMCCLVENKVYKEYGVNIENIACSNHLTKCFTNKLHKIKDFTATNANVTEDVCRRIRWWEINKIPTHRKAPDMKKVIHASTTSAPHTIHTMAKYWRENEEPDFATKVHRFEEDLKLLIDHTFGHHNRCSDYFCENKEGPDYTLILKCTSLWKSLSDASSTLIANAKHLLRGVNNNLAESVNNVIAAKNNGKRTNNGLEGTYANRCQLAVLQFNTKRAGCMVYEVMHKNVPTHLDKIETQRMNKVEANRVRSAQSEYRRSRFDQYSTSACYYGTEADAAPLTDAQKEVFLENFHERLLELQNNRVDVERRTVSQRLSAEWLALHRELLTASNFQKVCSHRMDSARWNTADSIVYTVMSIHSPSINHGIVYEDQARAELATELNVNINTCGLFIDPIELGLAASPDGITTDGDLVEIKCPYTVAYTGVIDAINNYSSWASKHFVAGLHDLTVLNPTTNCFEAKESILSRKGPYFYQVQGQLHITGSDTCFLYFWTFADSLVIKVKYDKCFWDKEMLPKLRHFFDDFLTPTILFPRRKKRTQKRPHHGANESDVCLQAEAEILRMVGTTESCRQFGLAPMVRKRICPTNTADQSLDRSTDDSQ